MHQAYDCTQLMKLTVQIECFTAHDDKLYIGTKQGHLIIYNVSPGYGEVKPEVKLHRYHKNFNKKPINQLALVPEYDIIIKLSDNIVSMHDLADINCPLMNILQKTKGATLFTLDRTPSVSLTGVSSSIVRLCVCVKRKLQLYYLKSREFLELPLEPISLNDTPRAIAWVKESICVGYRGGYYIIKLPSTEPQELFPTGRQPEPIVIKVDDMFGIVKESLTTLLNTEGESINQSAVKWPAPPIATGYDEPYLIGLLGESVEIRCWGLEDPLDIAPLPVKAKAFTRGKSGVAYLASTDQIWLMTAIPLHRQIKLLLQGKHFELALKLANVADDSEEEKQKNVHQIQTLYAFDLFHNKKYEKSMAEFLELKTNPYEVIKLFPGLLLQSGDQGSDNNDLEEVGYVALITYLTHVRHKVMLENTNIEPDKQVLDHFSNQKKKNEQLLQIIDTTLLKCYLQTNDALVAPLLRRNYCNLEEAEKTLKKWRKDSELVILYQTKGLHDKALELLKKQSSVEDSPLWGTAPIVHYLQNLGKEHSDYIFKYAAWVLEVSPEEGLKIFTEEVREGDYLPRPKVLDFLLKANKPNLVILYLEHVIHIWKETNSIFHNALVHQYRERIQSLGLEDPRANTIRTKLLAFLGKSDYYNPETVLIRFPRNCMFEERAIINGKLGRHDHALGIYILVLGDYRRALEYCDKVFSTKKTGSENVYIEVVKLLTCPLDGLPGVDTPYLTHTTPDLETALALLESHPDRLPLLETLEQLPDNIPVARLRHYLIAALLKLTGERRSAQLLKGLLNTQRLQVRKEKMEFEAKKIVIDENMVCPVCKKRFGNQSAFAYYPNGNIVHYSCQDKV